MAAISNSRNQMLRADSPRTLPVELPSNYTSTGDHTGTLSGSAQTNYQNSQITLSSNGTLQNAGGGQVTNGASIGSLNAGNITTGTLSAARIGAGSISADKIASNAVTSDKILANAVTTDKLNVSTLSAITANLGSVTAGDITGTADIDITGRGVFKGAYTSGSINASVHANGSLSAIYGVSGGSSNGSGAGIFGTGFSGANGVRGVGSDSSSIGVSAVNASGGTALAVAGKMTITSATKVSNLYADRAATADSVNGSDVSGTVANAVNASNATNATNASNSNSLGNVADSGWCRQMVTESGTASANTYGFVFTSDVSGVDTDLVSGRNFRVYTVSDRRKKEDIQPEVLGLDFINKLRPVSYRHKKNLKIKRHGLIAQEVEPLINDPDDDLARTYENGLKGVDYMSMVAVLIKAVQELNQKVNELTANIDPNSPNWPKQGG